MSGGDLQELFARLRAQSSETPPAASRSSQGLPDASLWATGSVPAHYQPPSVSSPLVSPPVQTPNPTHASHVMSPNSQSRNASFGETPNPEHNRTNNLLNLLKQGGQPSAPRGPMENLQNVASQDMPSELAVQLPKMHMPLLHAVVNAYPLPQRNPSGALPSPLAGPGAEKRQDWNSEPSGNTQDFLLNLLKKPNAPKPAASEHQKRESSVDKLAQSFAQTSVQQQDVPRQSIERSSREPTPARQFGEASRGTTPFEAPKSNNKASMFTTYVNPFDQLNSSSPLNATPQPESQPQGKKIEILKHNRDTSGNQSGDGPASKTRKMESGNPSPSRSTKEESTSARKETVSEALEDLGQKVDKQVERALSDAGSPKNGTGAAAPGDNAANDKNTKAKANPATDTEVDSSWESAEDAKEDFNVAVYNFPMRPFVAIHVKKQDTATPFRQDNLMVIAQMKKEFDQIDRALITASQTHIVYATPATKKENAGIRIIRQDTGDHKQLFKSHGERVFNVQLCNPPGGGDVETLLGTGVNGSVFWASMAKSHGELFDDDDLEKRGFVMPAITTQEENTSGSPVKTRAKMSNRHNEFFAVARGKQIHVISPDTVKMKCYTDSSTRKVDSEKFFAERALKISTGKAGKDFAFSEDDTVLVSLDKNGRFKFWDIREMAGVAQQDNHGTSQLDEPLWSLAAATSGSKAEDKPSVSSIMFLDKERPCVKGVALRYVIIGFKQNHILQLWDLGLGKAVQELRFPHEKDSDGICSISYSPKTGIIALGHPTRNSIYFVHLSAPKYDIGALDQAIYVKKLASKDPTLPRPQSTAIMSGLREFSFGRIGQLRSVDMLKTPVPNASQPDTEDETLFELYVMHSKGVVGLSIKKEDMGWNAQSKMVNPVDAVEAGVVTVLDLDTPKLPAAPSETGSTAAETNPKANNKPTKKKQNQGQSAANNEAENAKVKVLPRKEVPQAASAPTANGAAPAAQSPEKEKGSAQVPEAPTPSQPNINPPLMTSASYSMAAQGNERVKTPDEGRAPDNTQAPGPDSSTRNAAVSPMPVAPTGSASVSLNDASLDKQFHSLISKLDEDRRVQDAAANARQDALLRLVSSTLGENVDASLSRIVNNGIAEKVLPALTSETNKNFGQQLSKSVEPQIAETLRQQLGESLPRQIQAALPGAIQKAFQSPDVKRQIADAAANAVSQQVQQQLGNMLNQQLPKMATQATRTMVEDLDKRTQTQLRQAETQRQQDGAKIEQLSNLVRSLGESIHGLVENQQAYQQQMTKMLQQQQQPRPASTNPQQHSSTSTISPPPQPPMTEEEAEISRLTQMLMEGRFDEATMEWIQATHRQADLFDALFIRTNPLFLRQVKPLAALSIAVAVTVSMETNLKERLEWLESILHGLDFQSPELVDVAPGVMDVLSQRLQGSYMAVAERDATDGNLKTIARLNREVGGIRNQR
ncbi:hypothetical protein MBLNU230_g7063t1 [Neophaeotheca triangularis]